MNNKIALTAIVFLMVFAQSGYAKVTLHPSYEGTVMLTDPEGKVSMLAGEDTAPSIASESRLEVFDGRIGVTTEEGDQAVAVCSGNEASLSGAASVELVCKNKEKEGLLKVLEGEVLLKDASGNSVSLKKGAEQKLNVLGFQEQGLKAPATAAGQEIGSPINSGVRPVDSRSLESSPNR